jgi:hypothetical protein
LIIPLPPIVESKAGVVEHLAQRPVNFLTKVFSHLYIDRGGLPHEEVYHRGVDAKTDESNVGGMKRGQRGHL